MSISAVIAILLYTGTAIWLVMCLFRRQQSDGSLITPVRLLFLAGLFVHGFELLNTLPVSGGYQLGFYNAFSLMSWVVALLVFVIGLARPFSGLSIIFLPIAALSLLLQSVTTPSEMIIEAATIGLQLHILLSVTAYAVLTIAAVQAIILSFQQSMLHNRKPAAVLNVLPPMQNMEAFLIQILIIGFFVLSLSLVTGLMFVHDVLAQHLSHKVVFSIVAWVIFAVVLWGRWARGWRGKKLLRWTLGGFMALLLAYFGSKAVLDLVLHRF